MIWWLHLTLAATAIGSDAWTLQEIRQEPQEEAHEHQPSLVPS